LRNSSGCANAELAHASAPSRSNAMSAEWYLARAIGEGRLSDPDDLVV
jgi:hypothetical protein